MSAVVDFIEDDLGINLGAIGDVVRDVWDDAVMPILEEAFAVIGIEGETTVEVQRVSSLIYGNNAEDVVGKAITRAILTKIKNQTDYFPNYQNEVFRGKRYMRGYYRYAELGLYVNGLPDFEVTGTEVDEAAVLAALQTEKDPTAVVEGIKTQFPLPYPYFQNELQSAPYNYIPSANTLTFTDPYGVSHSDWTFDDAVFVPGAPDTYDIQISRTGPGALFWIEGPSNATEGETATYKIFSNRVVPVGESVDINFVYSGTAVDGTDFTSVASVTMLASTQEIELDIVTLESASTGTSLTVTIDSITNTNAAFEIVGIWTKDSVTTSINDDDSLILTLNDVFVDESAGNVVIPVKLEQAAVGAFTVDYTFTDISTIGGDDYDNTPGTLNFAGTAGEIQNITVPITADVADDDFEQFTVGLTNCSDPAIDITREATVTIIDGTEPLPLPGNLTLNETFSQPTFTAVRELIVEYSVPAQPGLTFLWYYDLESGVYPGIDPDSSVITNLDMLPVAILRKEKVSLATSDPDYITTRLLMQRAGFDIKTFIDAIEDNPDVGQVDDAYLIFAIGPNSFFPIVSKLLYEQFYELIVVNSLQSNIDQYKAIFTEKDVNYILAWSKHVYTPNIVGTVGDGTIGNYEHINDTASNPATLTMRKQVTATEYDEIVLDNPSGATAIENGGFYKLHVSKLGDDSFIVPLSWFILEQLSPQEQLEVFQYTVRLDITAIVVTELEFYETAAFFDLLEFALVVISIATLDFSGGLLSVLQQVATQYLIAELIVYVAELTGNAELAALVGVLATISLSNGGFENFGEMINAEDLLDLATEFSDNLAIVNNAEAQELAKDLKKLQEEAEEKIPTRTQFPEDRDTSVGPEFIVALSGVDASSFPALEGQYSYDEIYNYDRLVGNYVETQLQIGVV